MLVNCPICGKEITQRGLSAHYKSQHIDEWLKKKQQEKEKYSIGRLHCEICDRYCKNLKSHITQCHKNITWKEYCQKYHWEESYTITYEYKVNLSKNKKHFYNETEKGLELKAIQSKLWQENNPAQNPEIKEKMIKNRAITTPSTNMVGRRGVHCYWREYSFRSFEELYFAVILYQNKIKFEYEPTKYTIQYWNDTKGFLTTYLPDFYIPQFDEVIELKVNRAIYHSELLEEKYEKIIPIMKKLNYKYMIISKEIWCYNHEISWNYIRLIQFLQNEYKNNNLSFICRKNSRIVRQITQQSNLNNITGVRLYGN